MISAKRDTLNPGFCRHCGNRLDGTPFSAHCGTQVPLAVPTTQPFAGGSWGEVSDVPSGDARQMPPSSFGEGFGPTWQSRAEGVASGQPTQPQELLPPYLNSGGVRSRRAIQIGAAAMAFVVLIGAVVLAVSLLGSSKHASSYPTQASQLFSPVLADNAKIASAVQALAPGANSQSAQAAIAAAQDATQVAQQSLALLRPSRSQAALAAQINAALSSETTWLQTASSVLDNPSSPLLSQLSGLGVDAGTKLQQVDSALSVGDGATFPSSNQIVIYAWAANAAVAARSQAASYATQASQLFSPVLADNAKIASAVQALAPGANSQSAQAAIAAAQDATQVAQQSLALLRPSRSQAALAAQINAALSSETTWLQTASSVLDNPSSPLLSQLSGLGVDAGTKLQQVDSALSVGDGATFPSSNQIVIYASAANAAAAAQSQAASLQARTAAAETQFSNQVLGLLNQSASSFQSVNSFYQQLEAAAQGNGATITLAQAGQQISTIVANRTSLAAAAQAISAPTPAASTVQSDLVAAFNASLRDDSDLDNCLNQANDDGEAFIFQGCLDASSSDNDAATAAKQTFTSAYNQLRASIGQAAVSIQF